MQLVFVLIAMCYTDKYGRRLLLGLSGLGMAVSCIIVASSFEAGDIVGLTIFGICLFMATFSLGWGPMTWVVVSEVGENYRVHVHSVSTNCLLVGVSATCKSPIARVGHLLEQID